jgi:hypothetical protein
MDFLHRFCEQVSVNPANGSVAILAASGSIHGFVNNKDKRKHRPFIMVYEKGEFLNMSCDAAFIDSDETKFSKEGPVSLPGCRKCFVLDEDSNPLIRWSGDKNKLILVNKKTGEFIKWDVDKNDYSCSRIIGASAEEFGWVEGISHDGLYIACAFKYSSPRHNKIIWHTRIFNTELGIFMAYLGTVPDALYWDSNYKIILKHDPAYIYFWDWTKNRDPVNMPIEIEKHASFDDSISPNGNFLIRSFYVETGGSALYKREGVVEVIDLKAGKRIEIKPLAVINVDSEVAVNPDEPAGVFARAEWSPDSSFVATATTGQIVIWEPKPAENRSHLSRSTSSRSKI